MWTENRQWGIFGERASTCSNSTSPSTSYPPKNTHERTDRTRQEQQPALPASRHHLVAIALSGIFAKFCCGRCGDAGPASGRDAHRELLEVLQTLGEGCPWREVVDEFGDPGIFASGTIRNSSPFCLTCSVSCMVRAKAAKDSRLRQIPGSGIPPPRYRPDAGRSRPVNTAAAVPDRSCRSLFFL